MINPRLLLVIALAPLAACGADAVLAPTPVEEMRTALAPVPITLTRCIFQPASRASLLDPLVMIDGVEWPSASIQDLNVSQIEETRVIKPPESVARFGSRAADGAVIITMRKAPRAEAGEP